MSSGKWNGEGDRGASAWRVVDRDGRAHCAREPVGDGEAEADPGSGLTVTESLEGFEHLLAFVSADPGTVIDDAQLHEITECGRLDLDPPADGGDLGRVVDDVGEDALEENGICEDGCQLLGEEGVDTA